MGENFSMFFRTGENFLGETLGKNWTGDTFVSETGRATKKIGGRAARGDPEISPSFYTGGVYISSTILSKSGVVKYC